MCERLYMLASVCACLKGWEIMLTKGAPGALDWVSLLPFLPLSAFHHHHPPPLSPSPLAISNISPGLLKD